MKNNMNRTRWSAFLLTAVLLLTGIAVAGCGTPGKISGVTNGVAQTGRVPSVVCTNFAEYDFMRQIAGEYAEVVLLLKPGTESHSYEPTPADIMKIQDCDIFVYVGGDSDEWVNDILESMDTSGKKIVRLMDCVELAEEEHVEGMQSARGHDHEHDHEEGHEHEDGHDHEEDHVDHVDSHETHVEKHDGHGDEEDHEHEADHEHEEDHDHEDGHDHDHHEEPEMDEHVWTSPVNAEIIVGELAETLSGIDPENAGDYRKNAEAYQAQIRELDAQFREVIEAAPKKEIIVGDRFPFGYFCREYGLTYYAAFPGCSSDTQPSAQTIAFLIDKVREDRVPVVFHIELSNTQMAYAVAEASGAQSRLLNAVHNVTAEDFERGETYVSLMRGNVAVLKEALRS